MACTTKLSRGTQTSQMNMTTLQIEMNIDNTEITTLKSVTLLRSLGQSPAFESGEKGAPYNALHGKGVCTGR